MSNCCNVNQTLEKKLYFHSARLIINKTEKYLNKINEANKALDKTIKTFDNEANSRFHKFLIDKVKSIKNDLEVYKYENIQNINIVIGAAVLGQNNLNLNFWNSIERNQISTKQKQIL